MKKSPKCDRIVIWEVFYIMNALKKFFKDETVFVISLICAIVSMVLVPPNSDYLGYINTSVLIMLFCLMLVVAGLNSIGVLSKISNALVSRFNSVKAISFILVNFCYILAMFITNDVSLITIVPLTINVLKRCDHKKTIFVVVMETISANLGSMVTPIGNPQNIYVYEKYHIDILEFFKIMLPLGLISLVIINLILLLSKDQPIQTNLPEDTHNSIDKKSLLIYLIMFLICILTVLKVVPHYMCLILVAVLGILTDIKIFKSVDYILLLTFVSFFVFTGNVASIQAIKDLVSNYLTGREVLFSALLSQIVSNVPATLMLSGFTQQYSKLLIGVNIGGLGTIISSLASLISFKYYCKEYPKSTGEYLKVFSIYNFSILILLMVVFYTMY